MKNYSKIRILLDLDLKDRIYRYSDIEGPAYEFITSNEGKIITQDNTVQYEAAIVNASEIKNSISLEGNSPNIGNISITIYNKDNLHLSNKRIALESGDAKICFVRGDMYDEVISSHFGKIDNVKWDRTSLSFDIRSEESILFHNIPETIFDEKTFQEKYVFQDAEIEPSNNIIMRFNLGAWGYSEDLVATHVKRLYHSSLKAPVNNYWLGSRVDVVDATERLGDPEGSDFAIGEFAIVVQSGEDPVRGPYVQFPTVVDRYFLYTFIDRNLNLTGASANNPYEVRDIINNTMRNTTKSSIGNILNGSFGSDTRWTKGADWTIGSGVATCGGVYSTEPNNALSQSADFCSLNTTYTITFTITAYTSGSLKVKLWDDESSTYSATGIYTIYLTPTNDTTKLLKFLGTNFVGSIDDVILSVKSKPIFQIIKRPVPENSDAIGRPFPIVYGKVEKMWALHSISTKSTRQNSISAGDDVYIIAGHKIFDTNTSKILVYFGLDENASTSTLLKPGVIDFVPNPLPRSIYEIERWNESGYSLAASENSNTTNQQVGDVATAGNDTFTGTLTLRINHVVCKNSVKVRRDTGGTFTQVAIDDGLGNISGTNISGTIDYDTGDITITESANVFLIGEYCNVLFTQYIANVDFLNLNPLHKLIEIQTNKGDIVTAVKLRGDEYTGWLEKDDHQNNSDGDLPAVNGQPQFPIRYGLGNSKVYVSFNGMPDSTGEITGILNGLIEHPIDIIKHFLLNFTNVDEDYSKINEDSFIKAKTKLLNWKFGVAITENIKGDDFLQRIVKQCNATWFFKDGKFNIKVFDLNDKTPIKFLNEKAHLTGKLSWSRTPVSELYNDFVIKYKYNAIKQEYDGVIKRDKTNDQKCRDLYSKYGIIKSYEEITLTDIYDSHTANLYADMLTNMYSVPRMRFSAGLLFTDETRELFPSDIVSITYEETDGTEITKIFMILDLSAGKNNMTAEFIELF